MELRLFKFLAVLKEESITRQAEILRKTPVGKIVTGG